ncbi:hypothetical protein KJ966_27720 [bacterium]|nr:hypothetical protein [bacterium]
MKSSIEYNRIRIPRVATLFLGVLFGVIISISCSENEQSDSQSSLQPTNDSAVFLNQDADSLADQIAVSNSALEINTTNYVSRSEQPVTIQQSSIGLKLGGRVEGVALSMVAEVSAASLDDAILQATDIELKEQKAYVSYNMAGDRFSGAIQVISTKSNESPYVLAELIFEDIDVNAVYIDGNVLYAVGAADPATRAFSTPAVLIIIDLKQGIPETSITMVDIPSYAGTDVLTGSAHVFATVGADNGGLVRISKTNPSSFDKSIDFYAIDDARSLALESNRVCVLKGTEGQATFFDANALTQASSLADVTASRTVSFSGTATIPYSKSTVEMISNVTLMALGDGGIKAILSDGTSTSPTPLFEIPQLTGVTGLSDTVTVTNAASVYKDLLFRANGEAGVDLYKLSTSLQSNISAGDTLTPSWIGSLSFERLASANGLYYRLGWLFVADGLGGMKIVLVDQL